MDAKQVLEILTPIPTEQWCTDVYEDTQGRRCTIGHLRARISDADELHHFINVTQDWLFTKKGIDFCNIIVVNDQPNPIYSQCTPKERVLALLKDMATQ